MDWSLFLYYSLDMSSDYEINPDFYFPKFPSEYSFSKLNKDYDIDYDYCKGCGICEVECPVKAIKMERE